MPLDLGTRFRTPVGERVGDWLGRIENLGVEAVIKRRRAYSRIAFCADCRTPAEGRVAVIWLEPRFKIENREP
ncbi:MAG TPA: hypothetical protein DGP39_11045 [Verrucomicrobiales bacterium]|nr:hypothetical protein [Verrucomicrobiales bacterium]